VRTGGILSLQGLQGVEDLKSWRRRRLCSSMNLPAHLLRWIVFIAIHDLPRWIVLVAIHEF
jgi:hypothetical protein